MWHATILTIFPEMFPGPLEFSLAGKALRNNIWSYSIVDIRDFGITKHHKVDDAPYGGGEGLVMRADVLGSAIDHALRYDDMPKYYMSPRGKLLDQNIVQQIAMQQKILILCGRFEGIDERVLEEYNFTQLCVANAVLSGGEVAAIVLLDACIRLLDGVISNPDSIKNESFSTCGITSGLLEHPLYTRPRVWKDRVVPDVLLSGHHAEIMRWRLSQSRAITAIDRLDLLKSANYDEDV